MTDLEARLLYDELTGRGFSIEVKDGRLWVRPSARLDAADRYRIARARDGLIAIAGLTWHRVRWDGDECTLTREG